MKPANETSHAGAEGAAAGSKEGSQLLLWGHTFVDNQVSSQLSAQKIVFPTKTNPEFKALPAADAAAMGQYAGQTMTTGAQAKVDADNFIAFHLSKMGGTYSQLSAQSLAQPTNTALAGQVNTVFRLA